MSLMAEPSLAETNKFLPVIDELPYSCEPNVKALTIKTSGSSSVGSGETSIPISPSISISPHLNSPSPPSSAFVSALQSPYISPRALEPPPQPEKISIPSTTNPSPSSYSYTLSDDVPSTSYTPPSESYDFPIGIIDHKPKFSDAPAVPRISFSFPVPRVSFAKASMPVSSNAKLRSCDVYIGFHGQNLNLIRFCKWLKSELELQGIASFAADRVKYSDAQSHEIADRIICSASFGVVVVTPSSFLNHLSIEEIRFFYQKKNLIPILFDTELAEIINLFDEKFEDKDCREAFEGLTRCTEYRMDANDSNWRSCISKAVDILKSKLGRRRIAATEIRSFEELPFPRNRHFVGREKELIEMEAAFFGCCDLHEIECPKTALANASSSDGFADEESDRVRASGRYINLDLRKCKEPTLEAWIEPMFELAGKARSFQKQRSKHKKPRNMSNKGYNCASHVFCINGTSGVGKTELALEFAYRYSQRYKMVLWVSGDARYFRQNILNLSMNLGVDVSAEAEKDRGRIRSFDEQELDAFQRIKRELFREVPYLLIIDNLETEKEWWEGKDLHDLIPRNTGATHVIITTKLPKVMNLEIMRLQEVSLAESVLLMKGRRKKDYTDEDHEVLKKFDEKLGRLSFALSVVGSILSELAISPLELFEAIENISLSDCNFTLGGAEDSFFHNHPYLIKVLAFCFALLDRARGRDLASRMALSGAWFAPVPVSSNLLAVAANNLPSKGNGFHQWGKGLSLTMALCCGSKCFVAPRARRNEVESALMLVKLGLAKRATRQPGLWIQFHPIVQLFARMRGGLAIAKATIDAVRKTGNAAMSADHLWASAFLVFGFKSEPPLIQLSEVDMVQFIRRTAIPLSIRSFMMFSRCNAALELLKVCTNVLEEVEKSFVSQIQDWHSGPLCWRKRLQSDKVDEYVWQDVTLLKAALLETRAKLLLRGGCFDNGEELCRTCISIRTVMLGHNHAQTLAAQETLAKLVRCRSKI